MHSARLLGFTCSCKTSWTRPRVLSTPVTPTRKPTHRVSCANLVSYYAAPFSALASYSQAALNIYLVLFSNHLYRFQYILVILNVTVDLLSHLILHSSRWERRTLLHTLLELYNGSLDLFWTINSGVTPSCLLVMSLLHFVG